MQRTRFLWAVCILGLFVGTAAAQQNPNGQLPLHSIGNPLIFLLRDPVVQKDLNASPATRQALRELADRIDGIIWPARNQSQASSQQAWETATKLAQEEAGKLLTEAQRQRIEQIILWIQGPPALTRDEIAAQLKLRSEQRESIQNIVDETREEVKKQYDRAAAGEAIAPLEAKVRSLRQSEQKRITAVLSESQRAEWSKLAGPRIDVQQLGKVTFKAPPLQATDADWLRPEHRGTDTAGQVTVIHFFAFGCSNCHNNYEHYRRWQDEFLDKGVVIVGIHTPETQTERDVTLLDRRMTDAGFRFPILVDNDKRNWNAWGNSMWPSVYLVDRQGRIRYWWFGELNWQGNTGEQQLRQRITELLAERP